MARLLKFVTVSLAILTVIVSWIANPLSFLLVKIENRRYNEINSS